MPDADVLLSVRRAVRRGFQGIPDFEPSHSLHREQAGLSRCERLRGNAGPGRAPQPRADGPLDTSIRLRVRRTDPFELGVSAPTPTQRFLFRLRVKFYLTRTTDHGRN